MPAGGTTLRSTADYHETARSSSSGRHHHQHHRLSGPSSYVFAPSWMLRNGKKPPNNDQLAFTSFSGGIIIIIPHDPIIRPPTRSSFIGNNAPHMSFSSRKSDYTRPTGDTISSFYIVDNILICITSIAITFIQFIALSIILGRGGGGAAE